MKTLLIALPADWERRLVAALAERGISPAVLDQFGGEEEIFRGGDPTVVFLPADESFETSLQFCRRLRDRRPPTELQVLCCGLRRPSKEEWPLFERAGVNFVLPASISDFELGVRLTIAECLLKTDSPTGDVAPTADQELDFNLDLEDAPYGLLLSSLGNKFLKVNDGLVHILGYSSKEELLQVDIDRDIYVDPRERAWLIATLPLQNKAVEVVWKRKDGTPITILFSANVVIDEVRRTIYLQGVIWDITEQKRSEELLRESEKRYCLIADNVDEVVWSAQWTPPDFAAGNNPESILEDALRGWRFEYVSPSVERVFGYGVEECMAEFPGYRRLLDAFPGTVETTLRSLIAQSVRAPFRQRFELPMLTKNGEERWFEVTVAFLPTPAGEPLRMTGIARDITLRHEAEIALRESETQLRGLFQNMPDFVLLVDRDARIRYVNHGTPKASAESLLGGYGLDFLHESCRQQCREAFDKALSTGEAQNVEALSFTGSYWSCCLVPLKVAGKPDHVMIICTDITAHKKAAEAILHEQQLLRQMIDLQERERKFLSYEIHDGFAQQITGALFHLDSFRQSRGMQGSDADKNLDHAATLLRRSIDETRRLISGLRPPILDESGILAAVEYLVCEYRGRSGIDIMFTHDLPTIGLAPPLENAAFRIIQESLTNSVRHSGSDFIRIELSESDGRLQIVVFDEGQGFDPAAVPDDRFGLRSIRERVRLFDGEIAIETAAGEGCRIRVELPIVPAVGE